jgi:prepilin-type N-terminal cleavage/methylation domain-containing protein
VGHRRNDHGFTLVELLLAIILVGILAVVAVVGLTGVFSSGNKSACSTTLSAAQAAATTYYADNNVYPTSFDALANATPAVWSHPVNVHTSGPVMYQGPQASPQWSVTMSGGGSNVPNTYANTNGGGAACS